MSSVPALNHFSPSWNVEEYSPKDALWLCLASQLAYDPEQSDVLNSGFSAVESFEIVRGLDIDTQGYVAINDARMLLAFRGTESIPDWLTNLQAVKDPGPWVDTTVHEGFQDAFAAAALRIGEIVGRRREGRQVWVTGHSLGGALAVLLVATLLESEIPVTGLYTFAAPRVGDRKFARRLDQGLQGSAHWRVVNEGDLVPHVPPRCSFVTPERGYCCGTTGGSVARQRCGPNSRGTFGAGSGRSWETQPEACRTAHAGFERRLSPALGCADR